MHVISAPATSVLACACQCRHLVWLQPEGEDDLKKIQLMELAIMNGTYRDQTKLLQAAAQTARKWHPAAAPPL